MKKSLFANVLSRFALAFGQLLQSLIKSDVDYSENVIGKCNFAFLQSFSFLSLLVCKRYTIVLELNW